MIQAGWIPPDERTPDQQTRAQTIVDMMPPFHISGSWKGASDKAVLWEFAKKIRGKHLPALFQSVGACVGHGKAKAEWYLMHVEVVRGDPELPIMPYEPYGYAQSRVCAGISGNEDGSTGSGAAQAAKQYGVLRSDYAGLPSPMVEDGTDTCRSPGQIDKQWGNRGAPANFIEEGRKHLVRTTAPVLSADDVASSLQNGYPVTIASDWGGQMQVQPQGNPAILLNRHADRWMHQMMISGWWNHPQFGEIFRVDNSWGADAHGRNPDDAPPGGFWILKSDMQYIVRQSDSFAYSQFDGFPAPPPALIPWIFV